MYIHIPISLLVYFRDACQTKYKKKVNSLKTIIFVSLRNPGDQDDYCENLQSGTHTIYMTKGIYIYYLSDFAILSKNTHSWFSKVYQKLDECDPLYRWIFWYTFQKDCLSRFYFHIDLGKIKQVCRNTIFLHSITVIHNNISHLTYQVYNIYIYILVFRRF